MTVISDIELDVYEVEKFVGLACSGAIDPVAQALLPSLLPDINELVKPTMSYDIVEIETKSVEEISLRGGTKLRAPILSTQLAETTHLALAVATIGNNPGSRIRYFFTHDQRDKAFLMEEIANTLLFKLSNQMQNHIEEYAREMELSISSPISPGDYGFGISQQEPVLDSAGAGSIGVCLTKMGHIDPVHSIAFVMGLGKDIKKLSKSNKCNSCGSRNNCKSSRVN